MKEKMLIKIAAYVLDVTLIGLAGFVGTKIALKTTEVKVKDQKEIELKDLGL